MKKSKAVIGLILTLFMTVFLCYTAAVGIGPTGTGSAKNINTGLDLSGGVSITYQTKEKNPSAEDMSDTVYKMQKRVEQYSTEAQAYKEGDNRITVEIPGATDADAILNDLGKPGSLCFITQKDADGNENFAYGQSGYELTRSLDDIRNAGCVVLEGTDVADAQGGAYQSSQNSTRQYAVSLTLTDDGKTKFAEATAANVGKQIAIVYDNQVLSAPNVNEAITGGQAQITGMSGVEEAQNLASYIRIGSLSLELEELRSSDLPVKVRGVKPYVPGTILEKGCKTPTGKFELYSELIASHPEWHLDALPTYCEPMDEADETVYPFILCSGGRLPNAIHSRLHKVPWVRSLRPDPMADISIEDAQALGLKEGDDIELFTERETISVKVHPTHRVQKNVVFFYHGYSEADVNSLMSGTHVDPYSGFPAYNSTRCGMRKKVQR